MEVERERYEEPVVGTKMDKRSGMEVAIYGSERKVGRTERFDFGMPSDAMSRVIGGGYLNNWTPDFLQGMTNASVARFYFDRRVGVDVGDPDSKPSRIKRKQFWKNGLGYLCIPTGYSTEPGKIKRLYDAAVSEYKAYSERHPRHVELQETMSIDANGTMRKILVTPIDIAVGGGVTGNKEQARDFQQRGHKMTVEEVKQQAVMAKFHQKVRKLHKKLRHCAEHDIPFRNPFIAPGKRLWPVTYVKGATA